MSMNMWHVAKTLIDKQQHGECMWTGKPNGKLKLSIFG